MQARSQNLEKGGGLFWKSEKSANDLDPNFDCSWISFTRFVRKFRPKTGGLQKKKKKGLRRNWVWFFGRIRKFKGFFRPKAGGLQRKKKRSSPKLSLIFRPNSEIQTFQGGLFSIFHNKSASKALKMCDFEYFTSQWEGLEPPPGYATGCVAAYSYFARRCIFGRSMWWSWHSWWIISVKLITFFLFLGSCVFGIIVETSLNWTIQAKIF